MSLAEDFSSARLGPLALGAAQLGLDYGIANRHGKPDPARAGAILDAAWAAGVRVIDTAQTYGDSEAVVGAHLHARPHQAFHVVSKLAAGLDLRAAGAVRASVAQSVARLGRPLAAMLLHDAAALAHWTDGLGDALAQCRADGLIELAGVSLYTPRQFAEALAIEDIRVIQAPFNALDRRLLDTGLLQQALDSGRIVFLRSVYLQGLLLLDHCGLPDDMDFAREALRGWQQACRSLSLDQAQAALGFVRSTAPRCPVVVGCEQPEQVAQNAELLAAPPLSAQILSSLRALAPPPERVVNPSLWRRP